MSTELVAIERINIKKDNGDADALRSCLAHYLQQFLDSASIESMTLHELTIRIDGESVLNVSDKTGGVGLSGLDKDWQRTETVLDTLPRLKSWDSTSTRSLADPVLRLSVTAWCPIRESVFYAG